MASENEIEIKDEIEIKKIMTKHGIDEFRDYTYFSRKFNIVQLDGEFTMKELRCLVEISEYLAGE